MTRCKSAMLSETLPMTVLLRAAYSAASLHQISSSFPLTPAAFLLHANFRDNATRFSSLSLFRTLLNIKHGNFCQIATLCFSLYNIPSFHRLALSLLARRNIFQFQRCPAKASQTYRSGILYLFLSEKASKLAVSNIKFQL